MKRLKYILGVLLFSLCLVVNAEVVTYERTKDNYRVPSDIVVDSSNEREVLKTPSVDESVKVYDFADLLSESEERNLYNDIIRFINKTGLDVVIATIETNPNKLIKNEAADFYDYNYFKRNGIIFLIDMDIREYTIVTTGTAMDVFTNSEIDYMLDDIYPYMAGKSYNKACNMFINGVNKYYSEQDDDYNYQGEVNLHNRNSKIKYIFDALCGSAIVTLIVILIMVFQCRMVKKASSSRNYLVEDTKKIDNLGEFKIGSHTTKVRIQTSSGSSGGSYRSGGGSRSSSFRGSSGRSHGGGSRRF
jgi:uncharacterized protein